MSRASWRVMAVLLLAFLLILAAVEAGWTQAADQAFLHAARRPGPAHPLAGPAWELPLLLDVTTLGAGVIRAPLTIGGALLLALWGRRREALALVGAVAGGALLLPLVKAIVHRARPDLAWHLTAESDWSFPSGHSMGSAILYPLLGRFAGGRAWLWVGGVVALAVGVTRAMLGVHWASDVAAGWCLGAAWTAGVLALLADRRAGA